VYTNISAFLPQLLIVLDSGTLDLSMYAGKPKVS
jgi:hypothetical protein